MGGADLLAGHGNLGVGIADLSICSEYNLAAAKVYGCVSNLQLGHQETYHK